MLYGTRIRQDESGGPNGLEMTGVEPSTNVAAAAGWRGNNARPNRLESSGKTTPRVDELTSGRFLFYLKTQKRFQTSRSEFEWRECYHSPRVFKSKLLSDRKSYTSYLRSMTTDDNRRLAIFDWRVLKKRLWQRKYETYGTSNILIRTRTATLEWVWSCVEI